MTHFWGCMAGRDSILTSPRYTSWPWTWRLLERRPGAGKITEIGAVRIEGLRVVDEFQTLVNPQRTIPPLISHLTGITQQMVADAPRIEEIMPQLMEFLEGAVVVAHNAPFDVGFLNYELHRLRSRRLGEGALDTLPLSRALVPGLANYRLKTVADALGSPVNACHRALADAQAVAHIFIEMAGRLQSSGVTRLSGAREHGHTSPVSHIDKLRLTRDLPREPGVYMFLGPDDEVLLVGRADELGSEVRSLFMPGPRKHRGVRTALQMVERIEYEPALTPLEAMVREHRLLVDCRPAFNPYWTEPDNHVYIRIRRGGPGLSLSTSGRAPGWLHDIDCLPPEGEQVIGPFRRRTAARAAVALLQRCYPICHCPRGTAERPCSRGSGGLCLAPCSADPKISGTHDRLVRDLFMWLAGSPQDDDLDPVAKVAETSPEPGRQNHAHAQGARDARDHLLAVRRAYSALADARSLSFVGLWPQVQDGGAAVRLNLVVGGKLRTAVTVAEDAAEAELASVFAWLAESSRSIRDASPDSLVAVPQRDLDYLLSLGRWFHDAEYANGVLVPLSGTSGISLGEAEHQTLLASQAIFARGIR